MAVYITKEERTALLDACDFISTNADGATNYEPFEKMQRLLTSLFDKAKLDHEKIRRRALIKKYIKEHKLLMEIKKEEV